MDEKTHQKMVSLAVDFDRKQQSRHDKNPKRYRYNIYAMPQYLCAINRVKEEMGEGISLESAIKHNFCGKLLRYFVKKMGLNVEVNSRE